MWRVRLGRKFTMARVIERNFPTVEAARAFVHGDAATEAEGIRSLREKFGVSAVELSPRELAEAREALSALREAKAGTLREAVRFYLRHNTPAASMTMEKAIAAFVAAKEAGGRIPKHVAALKGHAESLAASSRARCAGDLSRQHVEEWLGGLNVAPVTKANALRAIRIFCRFCRTRGWMPHDPLSGIERPQVIQSEAGILTPSQTRALLAAACTVSQLQAGLAIKLFAGIRTSELLLLDWQDVTGKHIIIRAANAKTRSRRVVDIPANLASWLAAPRKDRGAVVPLVKDEWHRQVRQVAKDADAAHAEETAAHDDDNPPPLIGTLPKNFARHSFGTYHFALHQDEAKTAAAMGNTPAMVHRHYRALATANDARDFFAIMPEAAGQILAFAS